MASTPQTLSMILKPLRSSWRVRSGLTAFQLSHPLHFGDYGGLPLKLLWAALDILTIVVLGSGLYLWLAKGKRLGKAASPT